MVNLLRDLGGGPGHPDGRMTLSRSRPGASGCDVLHRDPELQRLMPAANVQDGLGTTPYRLLDTLHLVWSWTPATSAG